jgi:hypothetical protein
VARALVVVGAPVGGLGFRTESSSCGAGTRSSRCLCWRFGGLGLRVCLLAWALVVVGAPVGGLGVWGLRVQKSRIKGSEMTLQQT